MFNQEILDKIEARYGSSKAAEFCEIVSMMYDIKFNAINATNIDALNLSSEFDYERDWWMEASTSLKQKQLCSQKNS